MSDCIFCAIARNDQQAHTIFQDEHSVAFLDLHPVKDGHTLVIPRAHYERLEDVPSDEIGPFMAAVQRATQAVQAAMDAPAATVGIHNGSEAGQAVPHLHLHVIPRHPGDGGGTLHSVVRGKVEENLDAVRDRLARSIDAV
ncbi:MAG: HIT family protein [Candidatus Bipolaricaulia bacterium]